MLRLCDTIMPHRWKSVALYMYNLGYKCRIGLLRLRPYPLGYVMYGARNMCVLTPPMPHPPSTHRFSIHCVVCLLHSQWGKVWRSRMKGQPPLFWCSYFKSHFKILYTHNYYRRIGSGYGYPSSKPLCCGNSSSTRGIIDIKYRSLDDFLRWQGGKNIHLDFHIETRPIQRDASTGWGSGTRLLYPLQCIRAFRTYYHHWVFHAMYNTWCMSGEGAPTNTYSFTPWLAVPAPESKTIRTILPSWGNHFLKGQCTR